MKLKKTNHIQTFFSEHERLHTFNHWPGVQTATPYDFTLAGFYYSGYSDKVICTFCNGELSNWGPEDIPMVQHRLHFPNCIYVLQSQRSTTVNNGTQTASTMQCTPAYHRSTVDTSSPSIINSTNYQRLEKKPPLPQSSVRHTTTIRPVLKAIPEPKNFTSVRCRSNTFTLKRQTACCPEKSSVHKLQSIVSNRYNIFDAPDNQTHCRPKTKTYPENKELDNSYSEAELPDYTRERVRLHSFGNWSLQYQDPMELSRAGFFYLGMGDRVQCFACKGMLKCWKLGDDPWIEHAKFFPHCKYLEMCMGKDVTLDISRVVTKNTPKMML